MIAKKLKNNAFFILVILIYLILLAVNPNLGISSVKNSAYYIKEMLLIMPVIFILTALLDMWVPKEKIMHLLGEKAKAKGVFLAFVVGSISAGPMYAAFPMCIMLHKKGASIRNIIIILSSWAVIKIPMLLNEMKFLGLEFMIVRWILTVIAISVFSFLASKMIKDSDIPNKSSERSGLNIDQNACMGCRICTDSYPEIFLMESGKASPKSFQGSQIDEKKLQMVINKCPVNAISFNAIEGSKIETIAKAIAE